MSINSIQNFGIGTKTAGYSFPAWVSNQQTVTNSQTINSETSIYNLIKDDKNYQELSNSKFFTGDNLVYKLTRLKNDRDMKITTNYTPYTVPYAVVDYLFIPPKIDYKKYNVPDYLRLINNFVKSDKISDDLKQYYLQDKSDKLEIYYTKLDRITTAKTKDEALNILLAVN